MTTQELVSTTINPKPISHQEISSSKNARSVVSKKTNTTERVDQANHIPIAKCTLNSRARQSIAHYHHLTQQYDAKSDALSIQQFESLRLYDELICTTQNILLLINHQRTTDIDTLLRKVIEKFVFLHVCAVDANQAQSLHLKAGIALCKRRNIIDPDGMLTEQQTIPSNIKRLKQLDNKYKTAFVEGANPDRWFNLNGKTTCMEKLIESYRLDSRFSVLYSLLSQDVHSVNAKATVKKLLSVNLFDLFEGDPDGYVFETLTIILIESDRLIEHVLRPTSQNK